MEKRVREISHFFVAPRREFAPAVCARPRALFPTNTSTLVCRIADPSALDRLDLCQNSPNCPFTLVTTQFTCSDVALDTKSHVTFFDGRKLHLDPITIINRRRGELLACYTYTQTNDLLAEDVPSGCKKFNTGNIMLGR